MMAEETTPEVFVCGEEKRMKGDYQQQQPQQPQQLPRLVLVGAGYANLQVTKLLADSKAFESITLIDVEQYATYCGVIPCSLAPNNALLVSTTNTEEVDSRDTTESTTTSTFSDANHYHQSSITTAIDLQKLCYLHNITFVNDGVIDIDPWKQVLYLTETQQPIPYDILSLDIGTATKSLESIPGAFDYAIPIRPMHELQSRLQQAEQKPQFVTNQQANNIREEQITPEEDDDLESNNNHDDVVKLVVVGDGALSIELALCMEARWRPLLGVEKLHVVLVTKDSTLLPEEQYANITSINARRILKNILMERSNITLCFHASVVEVLDDRICLNTGMEIPYNYCLWATGGEPHDLIKTLIQQRRGLNITEDGWIDVTDSLQSTSHPNIFAAGDCCSSVNLTLPPKATGGIHTLQEGPILAHNLEHYASHQQLECMPKSSITTSSTSDQVFSSVSAGAAVAASGGSMQFISCGDGTAIGFAFGIPMRGRFVWEIKNAMNNEFFALLNGDTTTTTTATTRNNSNNNLQQEQQQLLMIPIPPSSAATMFRSINVENYRIAWATLQYMTKNEHYRNEVLKCYNDQQQQQQQLPQPQRRTAVNAETLPGNNNKGRVGTTTTATVPPKATTKVVPPPPPPHHHRQYCREDELFKGPHPHQTTA